MKFAHIDMGKVVFTNHALDQLRKRYRIFENKILEKPLETAINLLSKAMPDEKIDPGYKIKRLVNHKFCEAIYMKKDGWRFVIVENEDNLIVVTIEKDYVRPTKKKKNNKWRRQKKTRRK